MELYKTCPLKNQISLSSFTKYLRLSREFKNPKRKTDLCDYCEHSKKLKVIITKIYHSVTNYESLTFFYKDFNYKKIDRSWLQFWRFI